ncbi:MAG: hypothetical protein AAGH71_02965 [Planctomycetota bacterium]
MTMFDASIAPQTSTIHDPHLLTGGVTPGLSQRESFDRLLASAGGQIETRDDVRASAEQLVANAFIAPILRDVRESSQAAPPFQPTPAEKQFGSMLDATTAREIVRSADLPLVDRLTETFASLNRRSEAVRGGTGTGEGSA